MAKNKEIFFEDCPAVFINHDPEEYHIPSEDQKAIYMKMYTNVLHEFYTSSGRVCQSEQDVFLTGRLHEFYEELDNRFKEIFTYDLARPMYHITIEPNSLKRSAARTEYKLQQQSFHEISLATVFVDGADSAVKFAGALPTLTAAISGVLSVMQMSGKLKNGAGKVNMPSYICCV